LEIDNIKLDQNGHLHDYTQWTQELTLKLAENDNFVLSADHWLIINLVRDIYLETQTTPPMRLLIKSINKRLGSDLASSRKLYQLFPEGPVRLASKYAGLPKPKHCM
jgi:tRNA 2-thiouridine synthesizing protein E